MAEDAGASFLIVGLFFLSIAVFALGLSRSLISFAITRGISGTYQLALHVMAAMTPSFPFKALSLGLWLRDGTSRS